MKLTKEETPTEGQITYDSSCGNSTIILKYKDKFPKELELILAKLMDKREDVFEILTAKKLENLELFTYNELVQFASQKVNKILKKNGKSNLEKLIDRLKKEGVEDMTPYILGYLSSL